VSDRVLITGVTGFVGSHVLEHQLRIPDPPCVVGVGSFRSNGTADRVLDALSGHRDLCYTQLTHDLTVPMSPLQLLQLNGVNRIVHVASRCSVDESIRDSESFVRNNVDLQLTVLELARELGVHRFVHLSTDEVYGPYSPSTLNDHRPSSPYSASKAAQLDLCSAWATTFGVPVSVLTSVNMFGERQSQLAFVPRLVRLMLAGEPVTVHLSDGVPGGRNYVYVGDVARRLVELSESRSDGADHRVVFGAAFVDNLDLAQRVAKILDVEPKIDLAEASVSRPGYDHSYGLGGDYSVDSLTPFDSALQRTVEWFAEHPKWLA
jgi:dTDP-glucose 4,6-dehydratase